MGEEENDYQRAVMAWPAIRNAAKRLEQFNSRTHKKRLVQSRQARTRQSRTAEAMPPNR